MNINTMMIFLSVPLRMTVAGNDPPEECLCLVGGTGGIDSLTKLTPASLELTTEYPDFWGDGGGGGVVGTPENFTVL